jgi:hypothetical protein
VSGGDENAIIIAVRPTEHIESAVEIGDWVEIVDCWSVDLQPYSV